MWLYYAKIVTSHIQWCGLNCNGCGRTNSILNEEIIEKGKEIIECMSNRFFLLHIIHENELFFKDHHFFLISIFQNWFWKSESWPERDICIDGLPSLYWKCTNFQNYFVLRRVLFIAQPFPTAQLARKCFCGTFAMLFLSPAPHGRPSEAETRCAWVDGSA